MWLPCTICEWHDVQRSLILAVVLVLVALGAFALTHVLDRKLGNPETGVSP